MKLYMKQKVFSIRDRFTIKDESGEDRYYVEGKLISIGKKLQLFDMSGAEVAFIQQKVLSLLPKFHVYTNGKEIATIVKELSLLRPKYRIEGPGWRVKGNFWEHDYEIMDKRGNPIVSVHKVWLSWGDSYELNIARRDDEVRALATVLAIDCVLDAEKASASAATSSN